MSQATTARTISANRRSLARLEAAVLNVSEGLSMFDADRKLVICNEQYASIYALPPALTKPGTAHSRIVEYRLPRGMEPTANGGFGAPNGELCLRPSRAERSSRWEMAG